ncbi:hypothetical protein O1L60_38205 [Streptomyces diastatochromogenes]|nr:hypothetical protein [Streptomyces diastatochromogenes]
MAKAVIAAILLAVLVALGVLLWKAFLKASLGADGRGVGKRFAFATGSVLAVVLALLSLAVVMANVQGAAAPFASLLPMLPTGTADGGLADTLDRIRQRLAVAPGPGDQDPPALGVMIADFARYHEAMAVIAAVAAIGLVALGVSAWKRFRRTAPADRWTRRAAGAFAVLAVLSSLLVLVVAVANTTTAADPRPALLAFFEGGW